MSRKSAKHFSVLTKQNFMSMQTEVIKPEALKYRLAVITPDFKKVLSEAIAKRVMVGYTKRVTPFGSYPLYLELTTEKY